MTSESQDRPNDEEDAPPPVVDAWVRAGRKERGAGFGGWIAGRANRKEYWIWVGPWFVLVVAVSLLLPGVERVLGLLLLLIWIRRLHDLGRSGWLAPLINMTVAVIGLIGLAVAQQTGQSIAQMLASLAALIALGALPGQAKRNQFGPPPGGKAKDLAETFG